MHMSKETNTRHFNVASLQPLGVGWLQLLLILSMGSIYTKKEKKKRIEKYSISQQHTFYAEKESFCLQPTVEAGKYIYHYMLISSTVSTICFI